MQVAGSTVFKIKFSANDINTIHGFNYVKPNLNVKQFVSTFKQVLIFAYVL